MHESDMCSLQHCLGEEKLETAYMSINRITDE